MHKISVLKFVSIVNEEETLAHTFDRGIRGILFHCSHIQAFNFCHAE